MISKGFTVSVVCDFGNHAVEHGEGCAEFRGKDERTAFAAVRNSGWKISATRRAKCPQCVQATQRGAWTLKMGT